MKALGLLLVFALGKLTFVGPFETWSAWTAVAIFWQDVAVVVLFWAFDAFGGWASERWQLKTIGWLPAAVYWLAIACATINIPVERALSTPITWPMVKAARGPLADSILVYATLANALWMIGVVAVAAIAALAEQRISAALESWAGSVAATAGLTSCTTAAAATVTAGVLVLVALGPMAPARVDTHGFDRNVVVALLASTSPHVAAHTGTGDWRHSPFASGPAEDLSALGGIARGRNVIFISLESTAAQYLKLYGADANLTPNLDLLAREGIVFDHAYATYPESIKGLFSLLCSTFPAFDVPTENYTRVPCRSLAEVLLARGYRTGLFHSGRFDYLGMRSIVEHRGFQTLEDAGDIGGHHESSFGVEEPATVARMLAWIDAQPADHPFFLTYLPIAGHHPYEAPEPGPFPDRDDLGRYQNALRYGDASLGALVAGLRGRHLYERTLFVVVGDHGEAFGQHAGNFGHTFFLYDENVRVPFVVAMPGEAGFERRSKKVVSLIDLAPTVLDLLDLPVPSHYQGRSMLAAIPRMALFFADYSLGLVGLRDRNWKFIYELRSGQSQLFDLDRDPGETVDRSSGNEDRTGWYRQNLRDWSAAQKATLIADSNGSRP